MINITALGAPTLYGFTCYSRKLGPEVAAGHEAIARLLHASLSTRCSVDIYMDVNPITGQKRGDWYRAVALAIARSSLLFWWQHPDWFTSPTCLWEFDCFRARVKYIEDRLHMERGTLEYALIEPIPLVRMTDDRWAELSEPAVGLREIYGRLNRQHELEVLTSGAFPFGKAMEHLRKTLIDALTPHGGLDALLAVPPADERFVEDWVQIAVERDLARTRGQGGGANGTGIADPQCQILAKRIGRPIAQVTTGGLAIYFTARAERGNDLGPAPVRWDAAGRALWDEYGADELDDEARSLGLRLPTRAEAACLLSLLAGPAAERARCGAHETAMRSIWWRNTSRQTPESTGNSDLANIMLVADGNV